MSASVIKPSSIRHSRPTHSRAVSDTSPVWLVWKPIDVRQWRTITPHKYAFSYHIRQSDPDLWNDSHCDSVICRKKTKNKTKTNKNTNKQMTNKQKQIGSSKLVQLCWSPLPRSSDWHWLIKACQILANF